MLDCISGGRLVAGLPLGSPMDVNLCLRHHAAWSIASATARPSTLALKAWQAQARSSRGTVATIQLGQREPVAAAHPASRIRRCGCRARAASAPSTSPSRTNVCYCFLSYSGARSAKAMMDGYWQVVADKGREPNPYRAGFLQLVVVAETDARAEAKYARHVEYFYHKCLHVPAPWFSPPGNQDYRSLTRHQPQPDSPAGESQEPDATATSSIAATSSPAARPPCASASKEEVIKGLQRGQPDGAPADRLHAARADPRRTWTLFRPRSCSAASPRLLGGRGAGAALVAEEKLPSFWVPST